MFRLLKFSSVGAATASLLIGGILLALPSTIHERSSSNTGAAILAAEAQPALTAGNSAPAAARAAVAPGQGSDALSAGRPATAGMVVGIDPETGQMGMPTPDQMQKLSESPQYQVDHSSAGLLEVHHPDGSVSIDLQGRFQEYATVRIGPDGKLIYGCVDGAENAKRALQSTAPSEAAATPPASAPAPALEDR